MNSLFQVSRETFNLLTIGQRGVGKTVFLAGSHTEMQADKPQDKHLPVWFDCKDGRSQQDIEKILNYIASIGAYPPATMRVTSFDFSLKRQALWRRAATLCHFRMRDLPGEICHLADLEFRDLVLSSHGCCVLIDGPALIHDDGYLRGIQDIFNQVLVIASLTYWNQLKYPFALVVTKCDLLTGGAVLPGLQLRQQLTEKLEPLTTHLKTFRGEYEIFCSSIPIVGEAKDARLHPAGVAAPLLWLVQELSRIHNPGLAGQLIGWLRQLGANSQVVAPPLRGLLGSGAASNARQQKVP